MPRVAVTGHVDISEETASWVREALAVRLRAVRTGSPSGLPSSWRGITCLARGADQLFATVVLGLKGSYDVVLPAADYRQRMIDEGHGEPFGALLARAHSVRTMPFPTSSRAAYLAASRHMLSRCDLLLAVWDGSPSQRVGDTADVVREAERRRIPVTVLWPSARSDTSCDHSRDALATAPAAPRSSP